ncbi:HesA/MoeB/ThiF family protein [Echinicola vietnamensis]|uniref:Dinucleotide-utilizing enzyme possibly involved in molybdopterin or thiamin biosynthesis n=1 Tax=Echinicola vietnamensis (strain DSM 17526 / LMG 23754 / KMM 6221) TaxID=926556 RepID=L0FZG9_ECHVK|nr:HesA/MoeB/ThiF family protein [Echinicola vietnamensis]AGA78146.1 dinucleotide-utilizing enzyme possibly involved in molybdopterin or thiamin biosynthesis [Echinicola vietnamensis DSM 17526]
MNETRYQKQIRLKSFGKQSQDKLASSSVLIIGAGGLGTPVAQYLNGVGVGTLAIMDQDTVAESNLARQTLFTPEDVGKHKTDVLIQYLRRQNPSTRFINVREFLTPVNALQELADYDLIVDASDNFGTRYLVNDACVMLDKPFIYGALHEFEGQVSVMNYQNGPTYRCLFPEVGDPSAILNCDENGVLGILPGLIGTYQALEAVKVLTGIGEPLAGKLLIIDTLAQTHLKVGLTSVPENQSIRKLQENYGQPMCSTDLPVTSLTCEEFWSKREGDSQHQIIDVRNEGEFDSGHLDSAQNIPLSQLTERHQEINEKAPVILICQSGKRSLQAAQLLQSLHPEQIIYNLEGGMNALEAEDWK